MSQKQILIVTPHSDFGEIVSQSLGKEASCDVKVATSISEAMTQTKKSKNLNYALLDMEMGVEKVLEQGFTLRNTFPSISLILISKKYPPPEMEDIRPWKFLRKPFVQRELMDLIRDGNDSFDLRSIFTSSNSGSRAEDTVPAWYMDEARATKNLVAATSNLVVQEAILVSDTGVLAHSGELPVEAVEECSNLVRRYWGENTTAELIKPVRLQTTRKNHLLSATVVAVGIILALTFDSETPFDIMRSQTRYLTNVLKNPRLSLPDVYILPETPVSQVQVAKKPEPPAPLEFISDDFEITRPALNDSTPVLQSNSPEETREEIATPQESSDLDPHRKPEIEEIPATPPVCDAEVRAPEQESPTTWSNPSQPQARNPYTQTSFVIQENQQGETNSPINITGELPRSTLGPTEPSLFDVYYACLLVPRIRTHELDGDCANFLRGELPNIFLAYSWRLEELVIDRSYMQWVVRIPPTIAPAAHIKVIRRDSSRMLLTNFARFNRNEFLKDFWSPGYLLGGGRHLIPEAEIAEFIKMNRKQFYSDENLHFEPKREPLNYRFT
jgi:CheY-like chemotaxis protein/REP element-mobilizing transposase RayT